MPKTAILFLSAMLFLLASPLSAQSPDQWFYLDFGPNDLTNGNATNSPDANGNHWNNLTNPATTAPAVVLNNQSGLATAYNLTVASALSTNGINHGGLLAPDAALLDSLAIPSATQDYFFTNNTGALAFNDLNPGRSYVFKIFASRNNNEVRESTYSFVGANTLTGSLQSSGPNLGGGGYNGNTSTLYVSEGIIPDPSGTITLTITREAGSFAYINMMLIEEFSETGQIAVEAINVLGEDITDNGGTRQMMTEVLPAEATITAVSWSVDDASIAEITTSGELIPLRNGSVTVTARSQEQGSSVSGSKTVNISGQLTRQFLVDFGPGANTTPSPDANGNYWNNASDGIDSMEIVSLITSENAVTDYETIVTKTMDPNGPLTGDLTMPVDSLLNELAVSTATEDYFQTGSSGILTFRNLNVGNGYRFRILGSAAFTGRRNTTFELAGFNGQVREVQTSGTDLGGSGANLNVDNVFRSDIIFPAADGSITLTVRVSLGRTAYINALQLTEYEGLELCQELDQRGIVVMGSSVARGQGAPNDMGYAFQFGELLEDRFAAGDGLDWELKNISVGGNNTVAVLDRWARDLAPLCDQYVVYGLSLANEGIRNQGQAAFDQFRDNLQELINLARSRDITPVVVGNYSRRDFDPGDYQFIKDINLLIHEWDVPSVNVLGTNDNGMGNWVSGFDADLGHPNMAGHTEFSYAFVPSLFDALAADKPLPVRNRETSVSLGSTLDELPIVILPEEIVHSFTVSLGFRGTEAGQLIGINTSDGTIAIRLTEEGALSYLSPSGTLTSAVSAGDGEWHDLALTHYYADQTTRLYLDGVPVGTEINERLVPDSLAVVGVDGPATVQLRELFFYRSGMNPDEIAALHGGAMLKSSLEIYAPLDSEGGIGDGDPLFNLAQSTNILYNQVIIDNIKVTPADNANLRVFPNPTDGLLTVETLNGRRIQELALFDGLGRQIASQSNRNQLSMQALPGGVYLLRVKTEDDRLGVVRVIKE